jgi:hypothetical protein
MVQKSLSVCTRCGPYCGLMLDRDQHTTLDIVQETWQNRKIRYKRIA